ncbi:MAG: hypothetical protein AAF806_32495, partial [Bacteroidota bacterium]
MQLKFTLLIFSLLLLANFSIGQNQSFSKQQVREDLTYLREQLLAKHPNILIYNSKADFDTFFNNITIPTQVTTNEAYAHVASTSSIIQDGHTLFYPDYELIKSNNEKGYFIPLSVFWNGTSLFVKEYYSDDSTFIKGAKIIAINGVKSEKIIAFMLQRMMRDGNNFNYPIWVINQYFFEYYSYFYGCPKTFQILLEYQDRKQGEVILEGLLKADLLNKIKVHRKEEQAISLAFNNPNSTAVLTIKD